MTYEQKLKREVAIQAAAKKVQEEEEKARKKRFTNLRRKWEDRL